MKVNMRVEGNGFSLVFVDAGIGERYYLAPYQAVLSRANHLQHLLPAPQAGRVSRQSPYREVPFW